MPAGMLLQRILGVNHVLDVQSHSGTETDRLCSCAGMSKDQWTLQLSTSTPHCMPFTTGLLCGTQMCSPSGCNIIPSLLTACRRILDDGVG